MMNKHDQKDSKINFHIYKAKNFNGFFLKAKNISLLFIFLPLLLSRAHLKAPTLNIYATRTFNAYIPIKITDALKY